MKNKKLVRIAIILYIIALVASAISTEYGSSIPAEIKAISAKVQCESVFAGALLVPCALLVTILYILAMLGMWFVWSFGRYCFVAGILLVLLLNTRMPWEVTTSWTAIFDHLLYILEGIIVTLIFLRPE